MSGVAERWRAMWRTKGRLMLTYVEMRDLRDLLHGADGRFDVIIIETAYQQHDGDAYRPLRCTDMCVARGIPLVGGLDGPRLVDDVRWQERSSLLPRLIEHVRAAMRGNDIGVRGLQVGADPR